MDIRDIITMFYMLEEMESYVCTEPLSNSFLPSHEKFSNDLHTFREKFIKSLAAMMYDYMTYSIYKELIDGVRHCDDCFSCLLGSSPQYVTVDDLDREYNRVDPDDLYERAGELFYDCHWGGPFGGYSWGTAVDYASLYGKVSDVVYIDGLVDLQHNTDSILNKTNPFWGVKKSQCHQLTALLNKKRKNQLWISQNYHIIKRFPLAVKKLLLRFINLYLPDWGNRNRFLDSFYSTDNELSFKELMNYRPVQYTREYILGEIISADDVFYDEYY